MRIIAILLLYLPLVSLCQVYEINESLNDTFYILQELDSTHAPQSLPDGKWKYFYPEGDKVIEFHLKNNCIDGEFKVIIGGIRAQGLYQNDSIWSYFFSGGLNDTTFMVGRWYFSGPFVCYSKQYRIPFQNNDAFKQELTDLYGNPQSVIIWNKELGIILETNYKFKVKTYEYIKTNLYSLTTRWTEDGKIQSVEIIQDSLIYEANIIRSEKFYNNLGISIKKTSTYQGTDYNIPVLEISNMESDVLKVDVNDSSFLFGYKKKNGGKKLKWINPGDHGH